MRLRHLAVAQASVDLISAQGAAADARAAIEAAGKSGDEAAGEKATKDLNAAEGKIEPATKALGPPCSIR